MNSNMDRNKNQVMHSAIVAKASVKMPSGRVTQLVVFNDSTRQEFYWAMQARAARSPRRSWKHGCPYSRDIQTNVKAYFDFHSFVEWYAMIHHGEVISVRVPQPRRLASLYLKVARESIYADWSPVAVNHQPSEFKLCQQRQKMAFRRY